MIMFEIKDDFEPIPTREEQTEYSIAIQRHVAATKFVHDFTVAYTAVEDAMREMGDAYVLLANQLATNLRNLPDVGKRSISRSVHPK